MAQKLWDKGVSVNDEVEKYTVGRDRELDLYLAKHDVVGSLAHITMLEKVGLLSKEDLDVLTQGLRTIYKEIEQGNFEIEPGVEDIHSQVEVLLTKRLGEVGKKIHSGRSRNDQVLLDLKLFTRAEIEKVVKSVEGLFRVLIEQSERYKDVIIPGYTHLQVAMPSSFGLWFAAYAESLLDDLEQMLAAFRITNKNPLGSAAGYGSSFPLDREMTTKLLGMSQMNVNVVYAQMGRGKMERIVSSAVATIAATLSKLSFDACMYTSQNFGFLSLASEYTTGSSIMPHKKNPDVFELTRAKANKLQAVQTSVLLIANNLPSGYYRDLQILKEVFIPMFEEVVSCLNMTTRMLAQVKVNRDVTSDTRYDLMYSVEEVNRRVLQEGKPFRDAYKEVGLEIERGEFKPKKTLHHTLQGSLGNLRNDLIVSQFDELLKKFEFDKIHEAESKLING